MALIQLNINRLGQGWFILWEEAVLGGSLGVYQAAEAPGRWMDGGWMDGGWMQDGARGFTLVPRGRRGWHDHCLSSLRPSPHHLLVGCRETGLKIGELGLLGWCE